MLDKAVRKSQGGFTLVELMVTVVVIALLAMVALPAYNDSVRKGRRSDAKAALTKIAARQEQYFMDNKEYTTDMEALGFELITGTTEAYSTDDFYRLRVSSASTIAFKAEAQPVKEDPECQQMTIDQNGTQGVEAGTNPATSAPEWSADTCW